MIKYARGSVYWYKRNTGDCGVIYGTHPCVIVSANNWNAISDSVIVVPCTSSPRAGTLKGAQLQLEKDGYFLPSQITTVPKKWLFSYQGMLDEAEMHCLMSSISNMLSVDADENIINLQPDEQHYPDEGNSDIDCDSLEEEPEEVDFNSVEYIPPEKREDSRNRGRKCYWSKERMQKFISDCASNPVTRVQLLYNLSSPNTVYKYKRKFIENLQKQ